MVSVIMIIMVILSAVQDIKYQELVLQIKQVQHFCTMPYVARGNSLFSRNEVPSKMSSSG